MSTFEYSTWNGSAWSAWTSLSAWKNLTRTTRNAGIDFFTLHQSSQTAFTDTPAIAYNTLIRIRRDNTQIFQGSVTSLPRLADPKNEQLTLQISGPWHQLERCTYQQPWKVWNTSTSVLVNANKSRVILFQNSDGNRTTASAQITDALTWAISRGAALQIGTIDTLPQLPLDERDNLKVSDVVLTVLRWFPDLVTWFDYSTTPPTFHCRKKSNLSPVEIPLTDGHLANLVPRQDLQVPGIHISYEQTHQEDDETYNTITTDTAGDTDALDTVFATFELDGTRRTYIRQKVITGTIPDPLTNKAFLKSLVPALKDIDDTDLIIHSSTLVNTDTQAPVTLPRYLLKGNLPDWLTVTKAPATLTYEISTKYEEDGLESYTLAQTHKVELLATNATTRTYKRLTAFDSGESVPTGVAAALHAAWNTLQHQGDFHYAAAECPGTATPGRTLRLTGTTSELATLDALIQETSERYDDGTTLVQFGPSQALEADTLVALFRALRSRRYAWRRTQRTTATPDTDSNVELGGDAPERIPTSKPDLYRLLRILRDHETLPHQILLDPASLAYEDETHQATTSIQPREIRAIFQNEDEALVARKVQALCGAPYGDEEEVGGGDLPPLAVPETPATTGQSNEGPEAPQTDGYNLATADPAIGLQLHCMTRVGYFHEGNETLYGYVRTLTFTPDGRLALVSNETRVVIDVPVL